jgi:hypothetical protein
VEDILRDPVELSEQDLDEVAGGSRSTRNNVDLHAKNIGVGQLNNGGSFALANINVGIGELRV